jgi:hypothetical protein
MATLRNIERLLPHIPVGEANAEPASIIATRCDDWAPRTVREALRALVVGGSIRSIKQERCGQRDFRWLYYRPER